MGNSNFDPAKFFIPFESKKNKYIELEHLAKHVDVKYNFPQWWVFKVIGINNNEFGESILDFLANKKLKERPIFKYSKNKKYISYTFEIYVDSKKYLDSLYDELKNIKQIKFCL